MKNRWIIIICTFISLTFVSCDKVQDILDIGMDATIEGEQWVSVTRVTVLNSGNFTITGTSSSGKILVVTITGSTTGTYTLNPLLAKTQCGCTYKESISSSNTDWYLGTIGSVNLTEVNTEKKTISGTFEFTMLNLSTYKSITNGKFRNISYQ